MEGVTEFGARLWFWLCGAPDFLWTPFLRVTQTFPGSAIPVEFAPELNALRNHLSYPLKLQFMASDRDEFLRAFKTVSDQVDQIDFNCGCPAPTVVGNGAGSSLLADQTRFHETLSYLTDHIGDGRLSVKMRVGYHREDEFEELIAGISQLPLAHLTIHGRTRVDRYTGKARWSHMRLASEICAYPIIGSGDILGWRDINRVESLAPKVNQYIIGRGALRNPWIFEELRTSAEVSISSQTLIYSLNCFAMIEELQNQNFDELINMVKEGHFAKPLIKDEAAWQMLSQRLMFAFQSKSSIASPPTLSRKSLGRSKMLWNYLRSSLPIAFFDPQILRSKSHDELLTLIKNKCSDAGNELSLGHNSELDWVYSGARNLETADCGPIYNPNQNRLCPNIPLR